MAKPRSKKARVERANELMAAYFAAGEAEKKAKSKKEALRAELMDYVSDLGLPSGDCSVTHTNRETGIYGQVQTVRAKSSLDVDAAGDMVRKKYPKLVRKVFGAFDVDAFTTLVVEEQISKADLKKVTLKGDEKKKLVVASLKKESVHG